MSARKLEPLASDHRVGVGDEIDILASVAVYIRAHPSLHWHILQCYTNKIRHCITTAAFR